MSAKEILSIADKADLIPNFLHGRTQHKTMQARLSEDILQKREKSAFYRTEPGRFFISEALSDPSIQDDYKVVFRARRRTRDLEKEHSITIKHSFLESFLKGNPKRRCDYERFYKEAIAADAFEIDSGLTNPTNDKRIRIWTFSIVQKGNSILGYRVGRYRNRGETLHLNRSIGFPSNVSLDDKTLFSTDPIGAIENSISTLKWDLDLSPFVFEAEQSTAPDPLFMFLTESPTGEVSLVLSYIWACPNWFEPTKRRLSLNDPSWIDFKHPPNNLDDLEPWSQEIFQEIFQELYL